MRRKKRRISTSLFKAIEFATKAHRGQFRKGTSLPYILHPMNVAKILIEAGAPLHVVIAGVLHDVVEDTEVTLVTIRRSFGPRVADLVRSASEPDKSDSWERRKEHTLELLQTTPSEEILMLSCADNLDNIRAIRADFELLSDDLWTRFNRTKEEQRWYYTSLAEVFRRRTSHSHVRKLVNAFTREVKAVFGTP